jgi:glyoxylase-like metal-dependent hydrolase (beta-lactamase superfamily II)
MQPQQLGRMTVNKVMEMESGLPLPLIFPDITAADIARAKRWYDDSTLTDDPQTSSIHLSMHSFVIQLGGQNILVDTCNGNHKDRSLPSVHMLNTPYLENLAAAGFRPEDIHMVLCTHLHVDHIGWNTRLENGRWVPTFPNARYIFGRRDYEFFSSEAGDELHRNAHLDSVLPVVEAGLAEIIDLESPTAVQHEIGDGIWLEPAFGHSPGSCLVKAQAGGDEALFWGDMVHHPIQMVRPELTLPFDDDQELAAKVRRNVLDSIVDSSTMCFPAHFRGSSAGHVRSDGDVFRYEFVGASPG